MFPVSPVAFQFLSVKGNIPFILSCRMEFGIISFRKCVHPQSFRVVERNKNLGGGIKLSAKSWKSGKFEEIKHLGNTYTYPQ